MTFKDDALLNLFRDRARVQDVISNFTSIGERLSLLAVDPNARSEKSRLFVDLCDLFEGIVPSQDPIELPRANAHPLNSNLCSSIESLLDQLSNLDPRNRLWSVKATLAFSQIQTLAAFETERLEQAVGASEHLSPEQELSLARMAGNRWGQQLAA